MNDRSTSIPPENVKETGIQGRSVCRTRLLSDLPADDDAFGSHQSIAQAIAGLVNEEDGGKAIALTGSWGSGKSTIVRLLESTLCSSTDKSGPTPLVFVFDAWSHQGDPLRRVFLERLVKSLVEKNWTQEEKWHADLERIRRRREDTETTSEPFLTWWGRLLAVSTLPVPIGYILFNKYQLPAPAARFGLLLAASPVVVGLITWLFWRSTWKVWNKEFWTRPRHPYEGDSIFSFFVQKTREEHRSRTIRTPDPTSLEFQEIFVRILGHSMAKPTRTLVVVVDNLDRVPPQEALSIWTTMRTFFEMGNGQQRTWLQRFWLLVPFDPTALERLWGEKTGGGSELVNAFVDKTFQVTFRASPPVLSDWKNFFQQQLGIAFPDHKPESDFHTVYRLFYLKTAASGHPVTPRDIKLFANHLGALHRQWGDEIPLPVQAVYVLFIEKNRNAEAMLVRGDFLEKQIVELMAEPNLTKYLAALHYNVEIDKAPQVLLESPIFHALAVGNADELRRHEGVPGFLEVLEQVVELNFADWASRTPESLAVAAFTIDGIEEAPTASWIQIWKLLQRGLARANEWKSFDQVTGKGIAVVLKHCPAEEYAVLASATLQSLSKAPPLTNKAEKQEKDKVADGWVRGIQPLLNAVREAGHGELIEKNFHVPGEASFYIAAMVALSGDDNYLSFGAYFRPSAEPKSIVDELVKICSNGGLTEQLSPALNLMVAIGGKWPWANLVPQLNQRLQGTNQLQPPETSGCLRMLIELALRAKLPEAQSNLQALATQGHLMHHLMIANNAKHWRCVALCTLPIWDFIPAGNVQKHIGSSQAGSSAYVGILQNPNATPDLIEELANYFVEFQRVKELVSKPKTVPVLKALSATILEVLITRKVAHKQLDPSVIVSEYSYLKELVPEPSLKLLVSAFVNEGDLTSALKESDLSVETAELHLLAYDVSAGEIQSAFGSDLVRKARNIQKEVWLQELLREGHVLELVIRLVKDGRPVNLSDDYQVALLEHAQQMLTGAALPKKQLSNWSFVLNALESDWKQTFLRNLRDELIKQAGRSAKSVLQLYGEPLIQAGVLPEKADDITRILFGEILVRLDADEVAWLERVVTKAPKVLKNSTSASQKAFRQRVTAALSDLDPTHEAKQHMEAIAEALGLKLE